MRELLEIRHRKTFNQHLEVLGLVNSRLGWAEVKEILSLRLFLYARMGYHTREMYRVLKSQGQLVKVFAYLNINIDQEFARIQHEYQKRTFAQATNSTHA